MKADKGHTDGNQNDSYAPSGSMGYAVERRNSKPSGHESVPAIDPLTPMSVEPEEEPDFGGIGFTIGTHLDPTRRQAQLGLTSENSHDAIEMGTVSGEAAAMALSQTLKSTREARGLSLADVAEITRVRQSYLEAFEQGTYDILPSRAFSVGYIKAYAGALGLDPENMADLFKLSFQDSNSGLKAPVGAAFEDVKPNYRNYIYIGLGLVAVIAVWNLVQWRKDLFGKHDNNTVMAHQTWSQGAPIMREGVIYVSKKAPAPKDQEIPDPYVAPGMEQAFAAINAQKNPSDPQLAGPVYRKAFNLRGAIYGANPEDSSVTIQAVRSVNLIVRTQNGNVFFARQLGAGEAYRVPVATPQPVLIDVSDQKAFDVFYNGEYAGQMDSAVMAASQINSRAASQAKTLDQLAVNQAARQASQKPRPVAQPAQTETVDSADAVHTDEPLPYLPQTTITPTQKTSTKSVSQSEPSDTPQDPPKN